MAGPTLPVPFLALCKTSAEMERLTGLFRAACRSQVLILVDVSVDDSSRSSAIRLVRDNTVRTVCARPTPAFTFASSRPNCELLRLCAFLRTGLCFQYEPRARGGSRASGNDGRLGSGAQASGGAVDAVVGGFADRRRVGARDGPVGDVQRCGGRVRGVAMLS